MRADQLIIYTDIDGTAVAGKRDNRCIPPNNIKSLQKFLINGGLVGCASGRNHLSVDEFFKGFRFNMPYVEANGAYIYDSDTNKYISKTNIKDDVKKELFEYCVDKSNLFMTVMNETGTKRIAFHDFRDELIPDFYRPLITYDEMMKNDFAKCALLCINSISDEIVANIDKFTSKSLFKTSRSAPTYLEIIDKDVDKGVGIKKAIKYKELEEKILVCVGDYFNDIEMLELADIAICPSNASEDIKKICDYVSCDCAHGCLADTIDYLERLEMQ